MEWSYGGIRAKAYIPVAHEAEAPVATDASNGCLQCLARCRNGWKAYLATSKDGSCHFPHFLSTSADGIYTIFAVPECFKQAAMDALRERNYQQDP